MIGSCPSIGPASAVPKMDGGAAPAAAAGMNHSAATSRSFPCSGT